MVRSMRLGGYIWEDSSPARPPERHPVQSTYIICSISQKQGVWDIERVRRSFPCCLCARPFEDNLFWWTGYARRCFSCYLSVEIIWDINRYVESAESAYVFKAQATGDSRRQQQHLFGAYVFSTKEPIDMTTNGLSQAGFWNYLREEITVSLECQRVARIGIQCTFDYGDDYSDSMWANIVSYILARTINYSFGEVKSVEETKYCWQSLEKEFATWKKHLPATFEPYSTAPRANNPFLSFWYLQPWHGNRPPLLDDYKTDSL